MKPALAWACATAAILAGVAAAAQAGGPSFSGHSDWTWDLPEGVPLPVVPADNPMSRAKVELGRHLFYDTRLSLNQTQSCATCHAQERAFTESLPRSVGSTGEVHPRNSMSLANIAWSAVLTWANPNLQTLEAQALIPMFGEEPVEMGMAGQEGELLRRINASEVYPAMFAAAFPGDTAAVSVANISRAIASFQRSLISVNSPYDRYLRGDDNAVSAQVLAGEELFFSERLECFHCHTGPFLGGTINYAGKGFFEAEFFNTGLYNLDGAGRYPDPNTGIHVFTGDPDDMGRFRAPTLKNIAVTAPYMHDGSIATLEEVIDHYAAGGRTIVNGPNAGVGSRSPLRSEFMVGFELTTEEKQALLAYLRALTDSTFLSDPRHANPWPGGIPR